MDTLELNHLDIARLRLVSMVPGTDFRLLGLSKFEVARLGNLVQQDHTLLKASPKGMDFLKSKGLHLFGYEDEGEQSRAFAGVLKLARLPHEIPAQGQAQ